MERLQKVIAASGLTSRRKAEELITSNRVKVNGEIINTLGSQVSKKDKIEVDGKLLQKEEPVYFVLNKPKNTICSANDEHSRKTIVELINCSQRIFPVGRLDYDTTGVIILTNDGDLTNGLTHPSNGIPKTYEMTITGILKPTEIKELEKGVNLEDGMTLPAKAWITHKDFKKNRTKLELTITEGRNHQVKRMIGYFNHEVLKLNRKSLGFLNVNDLKRGEYRKLKPFEVKQLKELIK